jgi:hypothetical protein
MSNGSPAPNMQQGQPSDFVIDRIWCGPGKGAALQIHHLPTGISVRREIGYDSDEQHRVELIAELQRKIRAHDD